MEECVILTVGVCTSTDLLNQRRTISSRVKYTGLTARDSRDRCRLQSVSQVENTIYNPRVGWVRMLDVGESVSLSSLSFIRITHYTAFVLT